MRWTVAAVLEADALAMRAGIDAFPGKPFQNVVDRAGNPIPGAPQISEVALVVSEANPGHVYVGVDSPWAIGAANTLYPGTVFGPDGGSPGP